MTQNEHPVLKIFSCSSISGPSRGVCDCGQCRCKEQYTGLNCGEEKCDQSKCYDPSSPNVKNLTNFTYSIYYIIFAFLKASI